MSDESFPQEVLYKYKYYEGLEIGAVSVKWVRISQDGTVIKEVLRHEGFPKEKIREIFERYNSNGDSNIAITGNVAKLFFDFPYYSEVECFEKALSLLSFEYSLSGDQGLFYDSSASAFCRMGDLDKAISLYKELTKLTMGRLLFGDIYSKSFYMLGKIYEEQGDKIQAIKHYEKFLLLWKDADPGIAEVEDAKKRLAGLSVR
jgi:tetratricopeptide (TPR) repeat protein